MESSGTVWEEYWPSCTWAHPIMNRSAHSVIVVCFCCTCWSFTSWNKQNRKEPSLNLLFCAIYGFKGVVHLIWVKKSKREKVQENVHKDLCYEAANVFNLHLPITPPHHLLKNMVLAIWSLQLTTMKNMVLCDHSSRKTLAKKNEISSQ